jgi:hypothetical protein
MENYANNLISPSDTMRSEGLLKYVLRIFLAFLVGALAFGFFFGIFLSIRGGSIEGFGPGLVGGIIWAVLVFAVFLPLDVFEKIKCYLKYGFIDFGVRQERAIRVSWDQGTILDTIQWVLQTQKKTHLQKKDTKHGVIEAEASRSWRSFGEKITVTLSSGESGKVFITVSSRPKVSVTVIDFSKNFENVQLIIQAVEKRLKLQARKAEGVTHLKGTCQEKKVFRE